MISKNCLWCNEIFEVNDYTDRRGNGKFCSLKCVGLHTSNKNKPKPNTKCGYCNLPIYRNKSVQEQSATKIFFCCMKHKALSQSFGGPIYNRDIQKNYRLIAFRQIENPICTLCGYSIREALEVHHKDMNHDNNAIENLTILCCNCHSLQHRKNSGKG